MLKNSSVTKRFLLALLNAGILLLISSNATAGVLSFQDAWQRIQQQNPDLTAERWGIGASAGKVEQSRLLPNPTAGLTVENIGAKNQSQDGQETESTLMINQPILLGNKLSKRIQLSTSECQVQQWTYSLAYFTLYSEAGWKYIDILAAQHQYQTLQESTRLAQLTIDTIKKRMGAGKSSQLELKSAELAFGELQVQLQIAKTQIVIARSQLAALWNGTITEIGNLQDIGLSHTLLPLSELLSFVPHSPLLQVALAQSQAGFNQVQLSRSEAFPDLNIGAGVRHFQQTNDNALVAQVSVPITVFDRNQGNIHAAFSSYESKLANQRAKQIAITNQIYVLYQKASQTEAEMKMVQIQLIPTAESAFDLAKQGYLQGRFSYLDLLNAQQKLIDERRRYWQVHATYDKTLVELYAMLGLTTREFKHA